MCLKEHNDKNLASNNSDKMLWINEMAATKIIGFMQA